VPAIDPAGQMFEPRSLTPTLSRGERVKSGPAEVDTSAGRTLTGILLAAGHATRYGADKLLTPLPSGEPLALAAARHLRQGLGSDARLLAVLRPEQTELGERLAAAGFELVVGDEARAGMGHSLALAVDASPDAGGWLVALADMPAIQPQTIAQVAAALAAGASIAAPFHAGRRGHPVGFAASWRDALARLAGDIGARDLLRGAGDTLLRIETDDPGVVLDIDTPDDFATLQGAIQNRTEI
jgi:molybdenum cofactor cytidylyltransferase